VAREERKDAKGKNILRFRRFPQDRKQQFRSFLMHRKCRGVTVGLFSSTKPSSCEMPPVIPGDFAACGKVVYAM
jgi:hypothetical protein